MSFPEGYNAYNSVTLCFQTEYEKYLVDLFSLMSNSTYFYGIGTYLVITIFFPKNYEIESEICKIISF